MTAKQIHILIALGMEASRVAKGAGVSLHYNIHGCSREDLEIVKASRAEMAEFDSGGDAVRCAKVGVVAFYAVLGPAGPVDES